MQQEWHLVKIPLLHSHIIWAMYILGLSSSWGTSRICPARSPSEHQLAPALSPIWGPRPKPRRPEEVVYSPNDSCSHFTQRLFPPILPHDIHGLFLTIHSTSFISIIHHIHASNHIFYLHDIFTLSFLRIFIAGRLPLVPCVRYNTTVPQVPSVGRWINQILNAALFSTGCLSAFDQRISWECNHRIVIFHRFYSQNRREGEEESHRNLKRGWRTSFTSCSLP